MSILKPKTLEMATEQSPLLRAKKPSEDQVKSQDDTADDSAELVAEDADLPHAGPNIYTVLPVLFLGIVTSDFTSP